MNYLKKQVIFTKEDRKFMKMAIGLAEKAKGNTSPNPMVGAVIVKNGKILAKGFHRQAGYPHAEIEAINSCKNKEDIKGSIMYVTLEPCSIYGKTPPCVDSIIKHKIKKVIIGSMDPNPKVNGKGIKFLKNAGVDVETGLFVDKIEKQNEVFFKHIKSKMPFISCKIASSIDGKIAAKTSDSKWITSTDSRELVQKIRKEYDCILTGIATVIADDPYLFPRKVIKNNETAMLPDIPGNKAFYRIILDSNLRIEPNTNVVKTAQIVKTIIFTSKEINSSISINNSNDKIDYLTKNNIDIIQVSAEHNEENSKNPVKLNLNEVIGTLYKKYGITSILIESGPTLITSFLTNSLIDKFYFFIAPKIIGSDSKYDMFSELNIKKINDTFKLKFEKIKQIGNDLLIIAYPVHDLEKNKEK
jgi:diaminohydroxyphosphoribosylaminopyrimidine deaminase / 5-amino-6-(5-phosphoribosylamino)uracil reductase